ncbi:MAG: preprotein translocase subunit YajC [Acidimicrobiales bacterium]
MSPHLLLAGSILHNLVLATKTVAKPTSGASTIIFVVFIGAIAYFLLIRPQRQRARKAQQNQQSVEIGDEVMLTSGIIGRITWLDGDRARLEIAPGTEVEVVRAAIGKRVPAPVPADDASPTEDDAGVHLPYADGGEQTGETGATSYEASGEAARPIQDSADDGDEKGGS